MNRQTLCYYERRGLLAEPERSPGGHRLYPVEAVTVLRVIKAVQRLGFTLDEVVGLLEAGRQRHSRPMPGCKPVRRPSWPSWRRRSPTCRSLPACCAAVQAGCDDLVTCAGEP